MTRRPASWQAEKARTAKALRELPACEGCDKKPGRGFTRSGLWLCVPCAVLVQQASRAAAPRES